MNSTTIGNESISIVEIDFSDLMVIVGEVLFVSSALLSMVGSTTILFKIVRDWAKNGSTTPYDRFVFGLSCFDIFESIYSAIILFLLAIASPGSCRAWGFLAVLSIGATWYNGLLSFYFLMTVLSQVGRKNVTKRCEPWMHLSMVYFPIVAILTYTRGWTRQNDLGTACEPDPILAIFVFTPIVLAFLFMIVNHGVIYAVVRKTLQSSNESSDNNEGSIRTLQSSNESSDNVDGSVLVQKKLFREATNIIGMYIGCYLVAFVPVFVLNFFLIIGVDTEGILTTVLWMMITGFLPLQGFYNAVVYLKPFYTRFRAANPTESKWFVLHQAVFNSKAPRLHHRRVANNVTNTEDVVITDMEDSLVNPNEALFSPDQLFSLSDPSPNAIAEGDSGEISGNVEESKEGE